MSESIKKTYFEAVVMNHDQKREAILQAAEKRFAHFTVAKTTMSEIARDLGISKPLLYYYFPDKLSLYAAVIGNIIEGVQLREKEDLLKNDDPTKNIFEYLKRRRDFIFQYYNIFEFIRTAIDKSPDELKPIFNNAHNTELNNLITILADGKKKGILKIKDIPATAELLLNCLEGLRYVVFQHHLNDIFPQKEQFELVLVKEKELVTIFLRGLKP